MIATKIDINNISTYFNYKMTSYGVLFTNCDTERQYTFYKDVEDYDLEREIGIRCLLDLTIKQDGTIHFEVKKKEPSTISSFLQKITFREEPPAIAFGPCYTKYGSFLHLPHLDIEIIKV